MMNRLSFSSERMTFTRELPEFRQFRKLEDVLAFRQ
jgi:hypothetical protein